MQFQNNFDSIHYDRNFQIVSKNLWGFFSKWKLIYYASIVLVELVK